MIAYESKDSLNFLETLIGKKPTLGDYLLAIRQGAELTQAAFALKLEISKKNLCDIESNRRFISPKIAANFANKLGYSNKQFVRVCLQDLLNREGLEDFLVSIEDVA